MKKNQNLHYHNSNFLFKRIFSVIIIIIISISLLSCQSKKNQNVSVDNSNKDKKITIAVSIIPQETFVKAVAGDLVDVVTMIPPGYSPHNYQPTPKQMMKLSDSSIYFGIGVPTEKANITPKLKDFNPNIELIHLDEIVAKEYSSRYLNNDKHKHAEDEHKESTTEKDQDSHSSTEDKEAHDEENHDHTGVDPHIWLSPKRVKVMIETIKDKLVEIDPDNSSTYKNNADKYLKQLDEVDNNIKTSLSSLKNRSFIIYHPAFGYFADDYGLTMMTIEENGKEATAKKIQNIIDYAKKNNIRMVFYQEEFDDGQAKTIAKEINGSTFKVAPLAPDYINNLNKIANTFKEVLTKQ